MGYNWNNGYTKMGYTTSNMTFGVNEHRWEIPVKKWKFQLENRLSATGLFSPGSSTAVISLHLAVNQKKRVQQRSEYGDAFLKR